jgi:hypothetical protein
LGLTPQTALAHVESFARARASAICEANEQWSDMSLEWFRDDEGPWRGKDETHFSLAMQRALPVVATLLLFSCAQKRMHSSRGMASPHRILFTGASRSTPNASYKQRRRAQMLL